MVLMVTYSLYGLLVMYLFIRKLVALIVVQSRDVMIAYLQNMYEANHSSITQESYENNAVPRTEAGFKLAVFERDERQEMNEEQSYNSASVENNPSQSASVKPLGLQLCI